MDTLAQRVVAPVLQLKDVAIEYPKQGRNPAFRAVEGAVSYTHLDVYKRQDYIRTARAKGLSERTVVMRHAFRNALIPLATLVAFDIGGLIGGAIITETVFAFTGMGQLFVHAVRNVDPNPVMGVFLVTGIVAMVFNLIADLVYSCLLYTSRCV